MNIVQAVDRAHRAWRQGDLPTMARMIKRGLALAPRHDVLQSFWAECQLLQGNWAPGVWQTWNRTRWLSGSPELQADYRAMQDKWPEWDGVESLAGVPILVWSDGGVGDAINFLRYRPLLEAMGATVLWHVPETQTGLIDGVTLPGEISAACFTTVQSLPGVFGTTPETIPAEVRPWGDSRPGSGLLAACWKGGAGHANDRYRSIDVPPLWASRLVSLPTRGEWGATIEQLRTVDLLVTVDTALAHLAASLGVKVWLLIATVQDWRWLTTRSDTPWYRTVELFRQTEPGQWDGCLARVKARLEAEYGF